MCLPLVRSAGSRPEKISGIFVKGGDPLLIAARRVMRSDGSGPAAGILLFGRYLDKVQMKSLSEMAQVPLHIWPWDGKNLPAYVQASRAFLQHDGGWSQPLDEDIIGGYTRLNGLHNQPVLILRADVRRDIWKHGQLTARLIEVSLLMVGVVFGAVVLLLVDRLMLRRLGLLSQDVAAIGAEAHLAARVRGAGHDELGKLAACINVMLERLQALHDEVERRVAERTKELSSANQLLQNEISERQIIMGQLREVVTELERAKEEAEQANKAKNTMLSRVSHELRTPLNAILGFAQLMEMDDLTPEHEENIRFVLQAGRHLLRLVDNVLDITCIEAKGISLCAEPVNVETIVEEAISMIRHLADSRQITVNLNLPAANGSPKNAEAQIYVQADAQRLRQIVLNLLSNAVKYKGSRLRGGWFS